MNDELYFDYNANTPLAPDVVRAMAGAMESGFGNPGSAHAYGKRMRARLEHSRAQVAALIGAKPEEVIFTSSATEANNMALRGVIAATYGREIVSSAVEHPSVRKPLEYLEERGVAVKYVGPTEDGIIDVEDVKKALSKETALVTIMHANNETGAINDIAGMAATAHRSSVVVHTDATQSLGKIPVDVGELEVDLMSFASHKIYGPAGIGALFIREGTKVEPLILGVPQERGMRSGTESVILAAGFAAACSIAKEKLVGDEPRIRSLAARLWSAIEIELKDCIRLLGPIEKRLPNTVNIGFKHVDGSALLAKTPELAASTGATCNAGQVALSRTLHAMHAPFDYARGAVRLSIGRTTTKEEIDAAASALVRSYRELTK